MRGRVLILVGLIIVLGVVLAAVLLLGGGGDDGTDETTPEANTTPGTPGVVIPTTRPGDTPAPPVQENVEYVVIALQDLPRGIEITDAMVDVRAWPIGSAPTTSFVAVEQVIGKITRTDIPRESPIVQAQLVESLADVAGEGSDLATQIEPGQVAMAVPLDATGLGQVAYGFQPGDRIDVIMSFLFIDVDEEFQTRLPNQITIVTRLEDGSIGFTDGRIGRAEPSPIFPEGVVIGPSEPVQRPRLVTQRTIQDATVLHVGWLPEDGKLFEAEEATPTAPAVLAPPPTADPNQANNANTVLTVVPTETSFIPVIMVVAVPPQDAIVLTWAVDAGIPITYVLRSAQDQGAASTLTESVTLEYMINTYNVRQAENLPFAIEPAVTDIRRLDLSSLRTFSGLSDPAVQQVAQ
ncbi:MAG: hypothetical protein BroJett018_07160 [Chloroflexota bacterium]|nr:hypothetical protein [Chloroflexota bacterium]NOG63110.1 hypothetical protein [Chloroflexota bacterium]GIK62922.1 MAG: hypothetical protein BroJett018_07160 [Chloroflexota bacterium]